MDIQKELSRFKSRLDKDIEIYLDEAIENVRKEDVFLAELLTRVKVFILAGGKRLRGALLYHGYVMSGGTDMKEIMRACVGIELVHSFFLVHDDIMDRDEMRHNVKTLHREFADLGAIFFPGKDQDHFGISMAITAGDLLASMGGQCVFSSAFPHDRIVKALIVMQESISRTALGQAMDIHMGYAGRTTEREILKMYENKTARYTFESPLHLGGILGVSTEALIHTFSEYALPLGVAFQLQDDALGIYGESGTTGKSVGSDISEGKMTLLMVKALEMGSMSEKKELLSLVGKSDMGERDVCRVRDIFENSGARAYTKQLEEVYLQKAVTIAQTLPDAHSVEARYFLLGLAEYLRDRVT